MKKMIRTFHPVGHGAFYTERFYVCIISAESDDKYGHPDLEVLNVIQQERSIPVIVTENPKTMQEFEYDLK